MRFVPIDGLASTAISSSANKLLPALAYGWEGAGGVARITSNRTLGECSNAGNQVHRNFRQQSRQAHQGGHLVLACALCFWSAQLLGQATTSTTTATQTLPFVPDLAAPAQAAPGTPPSLSISPAQTVVPGLGQGTLNLNVIPSQAV